MTKHTLPFRQVHLDFHTSPHIDGIGAEFDKARWQETLREARVDSITLFSKCHHGWSYHPTGVGKMHPHLGFDLLRAQYEACKEIGLRVPIYLSAGVDNLASHEHPEWRQMTGAGSYQGWATSPLQAGFHTMDFFSPYTDYLCGQIQEVVGLFPDCDGIFLDIIAQGAVCTRWGMDYMLANGLDPESEGDRAIAAEAALQRYYKMTTAAARSNRPDMPILHNSGHLQRGRRDLLQYFSHLELESLPTGGWGYDHFPMSAKYAGNLGLDFLGMTGKFHTTWGEFGGYKHPNALRYECAAMLAFNARCSVGDQLHPGGQLDASTYRNIGAAYREVEAKEPWCAGAKAIADIAVLSSEAENGTHGQNSADEGAVRVLLEGHFLFDVIDREEKFEPYNLLVLPDDIRLDGALKARLDAYLGNGGKVLLTGESGLWEEREEFALDIGASHEGPSGFSPDYMLPAPEARPDFVDSPVVMYLRSRRIRATTGRSLGEINDPYFNRTYRHFCSHQHAPARPGPSGFDCGVLHGNIAYLAHPVFSLYRTYGAVAYREYIAKVIAMLLGDQATLETNLPSTARVSLNHQPGEHRHVLHLLYANIVSRGGAMNLSGGTVSASGLSIEIIEELLPLHDVQITLANLPPITRATLEPQGAELAFTQEGNRLRIRLEEFTCHQMVVFHEA
ncbi:hypothetical protein BH09VER1_BH09VER1_53670 [soil metagenome]